MPNTPNTPITNLNPLVQIGFNVIINKLPKVSFFAKRVSLPGLSSENPVQMNPFSQIHRPGDQPHWGSLSIEFMVDEDLKNWEELFVWLVGITYPESSEQWNGLVGTYNGFAAGSDNNAYSDIAIQTLTSAKNPNIEFSYHNCIPRSISGIELNTVDGDTEVVTCTVEFDFSYFTLKRLRNN